VVQIKENSNIKQKSNKIWTRKWRRE